MRPDSENDLAALIRDATGPLHIQGGGTRPIGRTDGDPLFTTGLTGISLHDPGALTLVVQAGTPLTEVEAALDAENQRLAFEPMDHRPLLGTDGTPTIGGVVAANVSGPRRVAVGACRDFMLGVRFVDGRGQIVKNGGRVMKNVTGYDLVKLMTGSFGTLGVLTEVSLKVLPKPQTTRTLVCEGQSPQDAVALMSAAFSSPFEVTGAAHDTTVQKTYLRLEGFDASVRYRATKLKAALGGAFAADMTDGTADLWRDIGNVVPLSGGDGTIWRISVRPSDAPAVLSKLPADATTLLDWGGGLIWVRTQAPTDVRAAMDGISGHATLIRGAVDCPTFHPEPAPLAAIATGLRNRFDPRGILNPGLMD